MADTRAMTICDLVKARDSLRRSIEQGWREGDRSCAMGQEQDLSAIEDELKRRTEGVR